MDRLKLSFFLIMKYSSWFICKRRRTVMRHYVQRRGIFIYIFTCIVEIGNNGVMKEGKHCVFWTRSPNEKGNVICLLNGGASFVRL